jgi:hypothetical protein
MTFLGTLQANRKGLPPVFKDVKKRKEGDYMVLYEENGRKSLHSWITNTKSGAKNVMLLTTLVPILGKTKDDEHHTPALIKLYNYIMNGTDRCDQLSEAKTCRMKSRRWPLSPLCYMLDVARVNARTVGLLQEGRVSLDTRNFVRELVRELVTPQIQRRIKMRGIQTYIKIKAEIYLNAAKEALREDEEDQPEGDAGRTVEDQSEEREDEEPRTPATKRCSVCIRSATNHKASLNLKKCKSVCRFCKKTFCLEQHLLLTCHSCAGDPPDPDVIQLPTPSRRQRVKQLALQGQQQLPKNLLQQMQQHIPHQLLQQMLLQLPQQDQQEAHHLMEEMPSQPQILQQLQHHQFEPPPHLQQVPFISFELIEKFSVNI